MLIEWSRSRDILRNIKKHLDPQPRDRHLNINHNYQGHCTQNFSMPPISKFINTSARMVN